MGYLSKGDRITSSEQDIIDIIGALGTPLQILRVNAGGTTVEWAAAGAGDVSKVGTPSNNQVGVWTGDGTLEGDTALTFDTSTDTLSSGALNLSGLTASEMVITNGSKNLVSAAVATYPSLTELTYLKGVTSALQTQINAKGAGTVTAVSIASSNGFAGSSGGGATPILTISTSITGVIKGNGTAISAATAGTDYAVGSAGLSGGQTIAGSTLTTENLTLRANAADLTTGQINVTSSKEATNTTTASVAIAGGLAVAKRIYALDMTVTNTITGAVSGNAGTASAVAVGGITGLGTNVATALAVNVGSAGAFVVLGGALGTPSSGTLTNATGLLLNNLAAPNGALSLTLPAGDEITFTYSATTQTGFLNTSTTLTTGIIQKNSVTGTSAVATAASSGSLLTLTSSTTGFTTATQRLGAIYSTGANSNATVVLQGLDISIANTGTTNTNQALRLSASGASTTNIALDLAAGELRLAGSAGTAGQILLSGGANANPSWTSTPTVTTLTTTGNIELGHATDTTLSRSAAGTLAVEGIRVRTTTPLIVSASSYTTDTGSSLNMDNLDHFVITAQAGALLFNSPGGTLVQGRSLVIRIKDNGTARALTWDAVFRAMGTALPSTTVLSKTLYLGFFYNSTDTKWDLVASAQEA